MRELRFYQDQLALFSGVPGTKDAARAKRAEMEAFLDGRNPDDLNDVDRETYDNMVIEQNNILRKIELQNIIDNYDELNRDLTSPEALDQTLDKVNETINSSRVGRYVIDLTIDESEKILKEYGKDRATDTLDISDTGEREHNVTGNIIAASKQVAALKALLNSGKPLSDLQRETITTLISGFENVIDRESVPEILEPPSRSVTETIKEIDILRLSSIEVLEEELKVKIRDLNDDDPEKILAQETLKEIQTIRKNYKSKIVRGIDADGNEYEGIKISSKTLASKISKLERELKKAKTPEVETIVERGEVVDSGYFGDGPWTNKGGNKSEKEIIAELFEKKTGIKFDPEKYDCEWVVGANGEDFPEANLCEYRVFEKKAKQITKEPDPNLIAELEYKLKYFKMLQIEKIKIKETTRIIETNGKHPDPKVIPPDEIPVRGLEDEKLSFEEILYKVKAADNALSYGQVSRYEAHNAPVWLPMVKDKEDWLHNVARGTVNVLKNVFWHMPHKLYSKIFLKKENIDKMDTIIKNVDALPEEEFNTLYEGVQTYKGDENEVSPALRKAVLSRARREERARNSIIEATVIGMLEEMRENHNRSREIAERLKDSQLSPEERAQLIAEKEALDRLNHDNIKNINELRKEASLAQGGAGVHGVEEENKAAREGSNISGRKLGKRFSKNAELEEKQAMIRKKEREARRDKDYYTEVDAFLEHEDVLGTNTSTKKVLGIRVNNGDRHYSKGVMQKSYMEDDLLQNLVTIGGVAMGVRGVVHYFRQAAAVKAFNAQIDAANQHNMAQPGIANQQISGLQQDVNTLNSQISSLQGQIPGTRGAVRTAQSTTESLKDVGANAIYHDASGAKYNWGHGWGSTPEDIALHTAETNGVRVNLDQAVRQAQQQFQNWPRYDRSFTVSSASDFLAKGGETAIDSGFTSMENFLNQAARMGLINPRAINPITIQQLGHITVSGDWISPALLTYYAGRGAKKALEDKEKIEAKEKEKRDKREEKARRKEERRQRKQERTRDEQPEQPENDHDDR